MMRCIVALAVLALAGPAPRNTAGLKIAQADPAPALDEARGRMDMTGMDLYMHDYAPTDGTPRKPSLWVHADRGQATEDAEVWKLTGAHAVIYGDPEKGTNDLTVDAEDGVFDRRNNVAQLRGTVLVETGSIRLALQEIEWDNTANLARSQSRVQVIEGDTALDAESLELDPDTGSFVLKNVSGHLAFRGVER